MKIVQQILPPAQYYQEKTKKTQIVLHFTAGSFRPDYTIQGWATDPARIGTHFIIGGMSTAGDKSYDGVVYQAIPLDNYAYHLGIKGAASNNGAHDKASIGIEVCNWGPVTKTAGGEFMTYVNRKIPADQVCQLANSYRGYMFFHALTANQIMAIRDLILHIVKETGIVLDKGRVFTAADFETNIAAASQHAIAFHTSYRMDKTDYCPMPELIKMLNTLHM